MLRKNQTVGKGFVVNGNTKKFLIEGNKFILRFQSNSQEYEHADGRDMGFQFNGYNHEKFQIVGVTIAVFKPLHVTS